MPGADIELSADDSTIAEVLKPHGCGDQPVRQEPPRRPEQIPTLRSLIEGLGHVHLPRHAEQLTALAA
jgi:hypothetical protein